MSWNSCRCVEKSKPVVERAWRIYEFKCNYSAFSGNRRTPSDYSLIRCQSCGVFWRSKAAYTERLAFATTEERMR